MSSSGNLGRLSPGQRLAAARAAAAQKMPYFRAGVQSLVARDTPGLGTFGVTDESVLLVDQEVLATLTAGEAATVLLHEYLHIYLKHSLRFEAQKRFCAATEADAGDWNKAADAEINDNLVEAGCEMPKLGMEGITPASLGFPANRTAEEYLALLLQRKQQNPPGGGGQSPPPPPGWGHCGSGAGNPLPNEPEKGTAEGRTELEQHIQRKQDSEQIQIAERSKSAGNVPAGLARYAATQLAPPEVSWQDKLSRSVRDAVTAQQGTGDYTFTERNRMQSPLEMLFGDDAPVLPGEWAPRAEVLVAQDTSGSMSDAQCAKVFAEAQGIIRYMGGAKITYVSIDCAIHTVQRVGSIGEIRPKGGGGTDFVPLFDALPTFKPKPNIVVFFTDGYGSAPEAAPKGVHTIWVVIDGQSPCEWGEHIHIKSRPGANEEAA